MSRLDLWANPASPERASILMLLGLLCPSHPEEQPILGQTGSSLQAVPPVVDARSGQMPVGQSDSCAQAAPTVVQTRPGQLTWVRAPGSHQLPQCSGPALVSSGRAIAHPLSDRVFAPASSAIPDPRHGDKTAHPRQQKKSSALMPALGSATLPAQPPDQTPMRRAASRGPSALTLVLSGYPH